MDSFQIAFNAIVPITLIVIMGYLLKKYKHLDKHTITNMNSLCFKFYLPILTFSNIIHTNVKEIIDSKLLIYAMISIVLIITISIFIVPFFEKHGIDYSLSGGRKKQGSMIQGIYRSNFVILGIPLTSHIAGEKASATAAILIMVVIPLYNFFAVVILSIYGGQNNIKLKEISLQVIKNPMIIASLSGILISVTGINFPIFIDKAVVDLSKLGGVLPMFLLGADLDFSSVSSNTKDLIVTLSAKLLIVPLIFLSLAILLGFSPEKIVALIAMYCAPIAVSSAIMAQQMGCDSELSTQLVVFSTVISCFTIFMWVFSLSLLKLI